MDVSGKSFGFIQFTDTSFQKTFVRVPIVSILVATGHPCCWGASFLPMWAGVLRSAILQFLAAGLLSAKTRLLPTANLQLVLIYFFRTQPRIQTHRSSWKHYLPHQVAITDLVGRKALNFAFPVCAREQRDTSGRHKPFKNRTGQKQTTKRRVL
jgi:hypothetical protein